MVLLDIGMPGLNGYAHVGGCGDLGKRLRIVAVTGWGHDAERTRSRDAGFDHHLVKPIDYSDLERILKEDAAAG